MKPSSPLGNRVTIIGCSGAGKSTLARQLGTILELPIIHLDTHYWQPGWVESLATEWHQTINRLVQEQTWIMDGNYSSTFDVRLPATDTIIFLDFPRWHCLLRVLKRIWQYRGHVQRRVP